MKRIIIAVTITASAFACNKSTDIKTVGAPVKYYFKIQPVEMDNTKNTTTTYKTILVD